MKSTYCLVYQGGIANVFEEIESKRIRIKQGSFTSCEEFCRGLRQAGETVRVAWCNKAGDIINSKWNFYSFYNAPFDDSFAKDFVREEEVLTL